MGIELRRPVGFGFLSIGLYPLGCEFVRQDIYYTRTVIHCLT